VCYYLTMDAAVEKGISGREAVIDCRQLLLEDSKVFSRQRLDFPEEGSEGITPLFLLERYLGLVRSFTAGIVRAARTPQGMDFRLLGTGLPILSFTGPRIEGEGEGISLAISGGVLAEREHCEGGMLSFSVEPSPGGRTVTVLLSGYCPVLLGPRKPSRLRKLLYRFTQALIHRRLTERFLADLYRERYGPGACLRVVRSGPPEKRI
jgi:hypothetical protein